MLAKYGYITRVAGTHWREKPWRLVEPNLDLSSSGLDEEQAAASRAAAVAFVDYEMTRLRDSLRRSADQPEEWRDAHKIIATTAWLTSAELRQAMAEIGQVLDKYAGRGKVRADRPSGARPARLLAIGTVAPARPADE